MSVEVASSTNRELTDQDRWVTGPYVSAVVLLAAAAVLVGPVASWKDLRVRRLAIPLRVPLAALDEGKLLPYEVLRRNVLEPAFVEALGTDQYLSWMLEDTSVPPNDPLRYLNLLVSYYTGGGYLVPHTPDVCYLGSGYEPSQQHSTTNLEIPRLDSPTAWELLRVHTPGGADAEGNRLRRSHTSTVPVRVCTFRKTAIFDRDEVSVLYTFHGNGAFTATRDGVRLLMNMPGRTHAYFSKVEVSFPRATREQSVAGAGKILERVLPVLIADHWPDYQAAEQSAKVGTTGSAPN